jgi:hypothetical protein
LSFRYTQGSGSAPIGTPVVCQVHELDQQAGPHVARGPTSVLIHRSRIICASRPVRAWASEIRSRALISTGCGVSPLTLS